ncbi:MAG: hypothetical protein U9N45_08315, partial [Gemmatimonadota bacterium]|nr:hypothetical protein [Gemmatimonadota bacterium]
MKRLRLCLAAFLPVYACFLVSFAQAAGGPSIEITPESGKYLYRLGDTAVMNIRAMAPKGMNGASRVSYRLSEDGVVTLAEGDLELNRGQARLSGSINTPGFLRCDLSWTVGGDTLRAACGCGFSVEAIRPHGRLPGDFDRFWREARA